MYNISNLTKLKQLDENASDAMKAFGLSTKRRLHRARSMN